MEVIEFGIRYHPLEVLEPGAANSNKEETIAVKHWVLVFTPTSKEFAFTFEAMPGDDKRKTMRLPVRDHMGPYDVFPLGTYCGKWDDLLAILEAHPQRGSEYSSCFNNCQHFVAIFLLFMEAVANNISKRAIRIDEPKRYAKLREVLRTSPGGRIWNEPNIAIGTMLFMPIPLGGLAGAGALLAGESTVTSTVSAGGLAGWLGMTTTIVSPAVYAGFAAFCAPLALGFTGIAGAAYIGNKSKWREATMFMNPVILGLPTGPRPPLKGQECSFPNPVAEGKNSLSSGSSVKISAPIVLGSYTGTLAPGAIQMAGASSLYEIARRFCRQPQVEASRSIDPGSFFMFYHPR